MDSIRRHNPIKLTNLNLFYERTLADMDFFTSETNEHTEREMSRTLGYRLLGWSIVSLWGIAVVILFRLFEQYPSGVDAWLLWVAPLLIARSVCGAMVHKQLRAGVNTPSFSAMTRMSLLFSVVDAALLLSLVTVLFATGAMAELSLLFVITVSLALLAFVYMHTPWVSLATMSSVIVAGLGLGVFYNLALPVELMLSCIGVLAITGYGVHRFNALYLCHLRDKLHFQKEMQQAAESNFIFNEHWQKMHVAAIDWDRDGVIKSWNPAAERLFGIAEEQAKGHSLELLFDPQTAAEIQSQWFHATEQENIPPVLRNHDQVAGQPLTCWYDTTLFHDGELIGIASYVIDLKEQPLAEQHAASRPLVEIANYRDSRPPPVAGHKPMANRHI